jgi:hypothetical protein
MADDTAANVLLTSELEDVIGDVRLPFARVYTLRVHRGPRVGLGLSAKRQLPSSCRLQNLSHQLSLIESQPLEM